MKTYALFLATLLLAVGNGSAQNWQAATPTIGIALLQASLNRSIPLYRSATDVQPFDTIRFSIVESGERSGSFNVETREVSLKPITFYEGDSDKLANAHIKSGLVSFAPQLAFRVLEHTNGCYKVVTNEATFDTAVIKNDEYRVLYTVGKPYWAMTHDSSAEDAPWFLYETWDVYLKRMHYVSLNKSNQLYERADGPEVEVELRNGIVTEVQGYWAKVESRVRGNEPPLSAWVKWTDGKDFLVRFVSETYY